MPELRDLCVQYYRETVARAEIPNELKRALKSHERVPRFIDNLVRELKGVSFPLSPQTIKMTVRDLTHMFIAAVKVTSEQRLMSDMEKLVLKKRDDEKREFEAAADALLAEGEEHGVEIQKGKTEISQATHVFDEKGI